MINPEVVSFPPPDDRLFFHKVCLDQGEKDQILKKTIDEHHFNIQASLILPDTPTMPEILYNALVQDKEFYHISKLPVAELCTSDFIQIFCRRGRFHAQCCDTHLDLDNGAVMTPDGLLHLTLDKFTYYALQLSGKPSSHVLRKPKNRFVVEVDTSQPYFHKGKTYYEKVQKTLMESQLTFDFLIAWEPDDETVCPSSVAKYFHDLGYVVRERKPTLKSSLLSDISGPTSLNHFEEMEPGDITEWIGCQLLGIRLDEEMTFGFEGDSLPKLNSLNVTHCHGFYTPSHINALVLRLKEWLALRNETAVPWISLTVYGSPDAPVTWGHEEHSYRTNGDNFYTFVITRQHLMMIKASASRKPLRYLPKSSN
ncbi:ribonuclease P protein subunit p40-like [Oratosquilla oratoria]|uniref:ribonuclease P protein subunit p40-like n=1 Tax=Oratosquilla oratoria TaxID=337810 RepID=UPI003F769FB0